MMFFLLVVVNVIVIVIVTEAIPNLPITLGESDAMSSAVNQPPQVEWADMDWAHPVMSLSHDNVNAASHVYGLTGGDDTQGDQNGLPIMLEGDPKKDVFSNEGRSSRNGAGSPRFIDRTFYKAQPVVPSPSSELLDATPGRAFPGQAAQSDNRNVTIETSNAQSASASAEDPMNAQVAAPQEHTFGETLHLPVGSPSDASGSEERALVRADHPGNMTDAEQNYPSRDGWFKQHQEPGERYPTNIPSPETFSGGVAHSADDRVNNTGNDKVVVAIDDFGRVQSFLPGTPSRPVAFKTMATNVVQSDEPDRSTDAVPTGYFPAVGSSSPTTIFHTGESYERKKHGVSSLTFSLSTTRPTQEIYPQPVVVATPDVQPIIFTSVGSAFGPTFVSAPMATNNMPTTAGYWDVPASARMGDPDAPVADTSNTTNISVSLDRLTPYQWPTMSAKDPITDMTSWADTNETPSPTSHAVFDPTDQVKLPNGSWSPSCKNVRNGLYCLRPDGEDSTVIECSGENIGYQFLCGDNLMCYSQGIGDVDCRQK